MTTFFHKSELSIRRCLNFGRTMSSLTNVNSPFLVLPPTNLRTSLKVIAEFNFVFTLFS